jgi:hypothetical protein
MAGYGYMDMGEKQTERSRWTPLTRMLLSGEMTQERQKELTMGERFDRWMVNEGYRRLYVDIMEPPPPPPGPPLSLRRVCSRVRDQVC